METPLVKSSHDNVIGESSKKAMKTVNIRTLFTSRGNGIDVVVPVESIRAISERFVNTAYGFFFLRKMVHGLFPLILQKWSPDVDLLKEDDENVPVWVKLHGVPVTAFSEDGLSAITTKLGTLLMLDSYTSDMCLQSWGMSSYARAMIEVRADVELKDTIMVDMPKIMGEGYYTCTIHVETP
ncbi:putative reverse transcriptase domain-containing protein [Tanacetum coccineum]